MPSHQVRREPLPKGYQYGDAARVKCYAIARGVTADEASARLHRTVHSPGRIDFATLTSFCSCGGQWDYTSGRQPIHIDPPEQH